MNHHSYNQHFIKTTTTTILIQETSVRTSLTVLSDASIGKSTLGKSTIKDTFTFDSTPGISEPEEVDSDVFEEANRTLSLVTEDLESKSNSLVLRNVSKFYGPLLAVDNLCLTIQKVFAFQEFCIYTNIIFKNVFCKYFKNIYQIV